MYSVKNCVYGELIMAMGMKSFELMYYNEPIFRVLIRNDTPVQQVCLNAKFSILQPLDRTLSVKSLNRFFEGRCFSAQRQDLHELLRMVDVPYFDAYLICRKTHGLLCEQPTWIRFEDEQSMTFEQARKILQDLCDRFM